MSDDPELQAIFAEEATGLLDRLSQLALSLEADAEPQKVVRAMFRATHTLKGSATLVGLSGVAAVTHTLEEQLVRLREGEQAIDAAVVDLLLEVVDALRAVIGAQLAGDAEAAVDPRLVARLAGEAPAAPTSESAPPPPTDDGVPPELSAATTAPAPPTPAPAPPAPTAPAAPPPAPGVPPTPPAPAPGRPVDVLSVGRERLDRLVRLAGESRTARLRVLDAIGADRAADPDVEAAMAELERTLESLQDQLIAARMVTLAAIAEPLHRAVREVARARGREIDYVLEGERIEVDRGVLDQLRDPLLHLVRNAADHGVEDPDARAAAGKPRAGRVVVHARTAGRTLVVEVSDDGAGLDLAALRGGDASVSDEEAVERIFAPGVSTAAAVTDVSGRGVGLDVVRARVERIRGTVEVRSERGRGTTFTLTVPVTLAVVRCLVVASGGERFAIPAHAVTSVAEAEVEALVPLEGGAAIWVGGEIVPLASLATTLGVPGPEALGDGGSAVVMTAPGGRRIALRVNGLHGQRDVTLQELGDVVPTLELVAGASIEPDGTVLLVLDPLALVTRAARVGRRAVAATPEPAAAAVQGGGRPAGATVLVAEDSLTVRELQRSILERAGYRVRTAVDGREALAHLAEERPDLVLTDIEMPNLDGFGLIEAIRARPELASLPVLIMSSRDDPEDRARGLRVGADGYIVKQAFDAETLLAAVGRVLGEEPVGS